MNLRFKYLNQLINLEPIDKEYKFSHQNEEVKVEAFNILFYISELKRILINLDNEIEENYHNNKQNYQNYANACQDKLEKSIKNIPEANELKIKEHFKIFELEYDDFESIYHLLEGYWSCLYLGDDWLEPGKSPSGPNNAIEIQNDLYHFTKRKTVQIIKNILKSYKPKQKRWFEVGLLFATGEMDKLKRKFNNNATAIAKHLFEENYEGYRPYISSSLGFSHKDQKNIFNYPDKLEKINDYCVKNDITIIDNWKLKKQPQ